tara:strand:+ start:491 stop:667 length:177 start_codon:yes stop_codon:yes gene_type:complete
MELQQQEQVEVVRQVVQGLMVEPVVVEVLMVDQDQQILVAVEQVIMDHQQLVEQVDLV